MSPIRRIVDDLGLTDGEAEALAFTFVVGLVLCAMLLALVWFITAAFG